MILFDPLQPLLSIHSLLAAAAVFAPILQLVSSAKQKTNAFVWLKKSVQSAIGKKMAPTNKQKHKKKSTAVMNEWRMGFG